ncbi:4-phosphoerythronate dehydrogenase [Legionella cardiaca]|uniref:4-phosphoerythronate dehydrogenase n=1 Tax=Legionella cardiaca TaxID=1071983 RepID=A0ABY8AT10_9GAMM|nr:4-phosphoerythronate dehydrogenase [Legionella cardiaca]WED43818.1 4-phosphoerythronate dehydrogenase [Legionella cardiaca]
MKILADASLPGLLEAFPQPFELTLYHEAKDIPQQLKNQQILLCRSTLKVTEELLKNSSLSYVATASSGTDHIDENYLQNHRIGLIDAKGSNASAVADYVMATLAFLECHKGFKGTKAAVIGVGEVGTKVAQRLRATGMEVLCYDPPKSKRDKDFITCSFEAITECDLISVHANLHNLLPTPSLNLINDGVLKQLKPQSVIINASRGGIVNEEDLLRQKKPFFYCTDVFSNEPAIRQGIVDFATLCTPHIAGHSIEAKSDAITMISQKLHLAYKLPFVKPSLPVLAKLPSYYPHHTWQDYVLSLYNPLVETEILKNTHDLKLAFLNLRKAHQNRHDFQLYAKAVQTNKQLLQILGVNA